LSGGVDEDGRGEVFGSEFAVAGDDGGVFECLIEFADVADPGAGGEFALEIGSDSAGERFADDAIEEMLREAGEIVEAFAERGEIDAEGVEPKEEVGAEFSCGGEFGERSVSGGDDAEVAGSGSRVADGSVFTAFDDAEEFDLDGGWDVADFIEEESAATGLLQEAFAIAVGTGEGTADVSEEFAFDDLRAESGEVDGEEGACAAGRMFVDGFGDEFLAGAAFAGDKDGGVGFGDECDLFEDGLHGGGLADEDGSDGVGGFGWRTIGRGTFDESFDETGGGVEVEGFGEVFGGTAVNGADGGLQSPKGGHDDDWDLKIAGAEAFEESEAVDAGHPNVEEDDVGGIGFDGVEGFFGVGGDGDGIAFVGEVVAEGPTDKGFIINNEDSIHV